MVVCVTDAYDKSSGEVEKYTGNKNIILEDVRYSYNMLQKELEEIEERRSTFYDMDRSMNGLDVSAIDALLHSMSVQFIDEKTNSLVVFIADLDEEKIGTFQTIMSDKEFIRLESGYTVLTVGNGTRDADNEPDIGGTNPPWYPAFFDYRLKLFNVC